MIRRFREWRQNRKTDRFLALIQCRSGYHPEITQGDAPGFCRWCGHDVLAEVAAKRFEQC